MSSQRLRSSCWAGRAPPWRSRGGGLRRFLGANVHAIGWRSQEALPRLTSRSTVLDPLSPGPSVQPGVQPDEDHGRDGLGPADRRDGHPGVRWHAERFDIAEDAGEFLDAVRRILSGDSDDGRAALRHAYAVANSCRGVGERLLDLIDGRIGSDERRTESARGCGIPRTEQIR